MTEPTNKDILDVTVRELLKEFEGENLNKAANDFIITLALTAEAVTRKTK